MERILEVAHALDVSLSAVQAEALDTYAGLLATKGVEAGVISAGDGQITLERHVLDSLRAVPYVAGSFCYDLGSGGGLPGIPVAIALPEVKVSMVDRRQRKVGFLEFCLDTLALSNGDALLADIDSLQDPAPTCLSRALASPEASWASASPLLAPGGRLIYFAGKGFDGVGPLVDLVSCETVRPGVLATGGPLAIMTRE